MQYRGTIREWKDEKGFGFISPDQGGKDVFIHISAVRKAGRRPVNGDSVGFDVVTSADGRTRAANVLILGATGATQFSPVPYLLAAFCVGAGAMFFARTGLPVVLAYPIIGAITYFVYAHDKAQSQTGGYRVPEATLHLLELLGGWVGGYLAQAYLRHKSAKRSYQIVFWGIVMLHIFGWSWWIYSGMMPLPNSR